jgi:hypothetical protein
MELFPTVSQRPIHATCSIRVIFLYLPNDEGKSISKFQMDIELKQTRVKGKVIPVQAMEALRVAGG